MHVVVLDAAVGASMKEMLASLKDAPVLTIGESEQFAEADGILNFVRDGDKLRFEANLDAAQQAGLRISAQFLKLAKAVRKEEPGEALSRFSGGEVIRAPVPVWIVLNSLVGEHDAVQWDGWNLVVSTHVGRHFERAAPAGMLDFFFLAA